MESHVVKYTLNAMPEFSHKEPYHTWFCTEYKTLYLWGQNSNNRHTPKAPPTERPLEKCSNRPTIESQAVQYTLNSKPELSLKEQYHTWFCTQFKTLYLWGQNSDNTITPEARTTERSLEKCPYRPTIESQGVNHTLNAKGELSLKEPYHTWYCTQFKTLYP